MCDVTTDIESLIDFAVTTGRSHLRAEPYESAWKVP
jgi:hypothetical protein